MIIAINLLNNDDADRNNLNAAAANAVPRPIKAVRAAAFAATSSCHVLLLRCAAPAYAPRAHVRTPRSFGTKGGEQVHSSEPPEGR